jgi:hypothetical protein
MVGSVAARFVENERLTMTWNKVAERVPDAPVGVELFYAGLGAELRIEPYRDCRRELAFWDGKTFRELGTGHCCFEPWREPEQMPTHWRELPPTP